MRLLFFSVLWMMMGGCTFSETPNVVEPYAEQLALQSEKVEYTGQFHYHLENCEGSQATLLNNYSHASHNLTLTIDRSRIELIRHDKRNEPRLIGSWNSENQTLRVSSAGWGIADMEDWRNSVGVMEINQDEISGQIKNITISSEGTFCEAELRFAGIAV